MDFGKWLRVERKKKGYTLQQVADAGNTTKGQIHDLESGRTVDPKLSTLKTMASVMGGAAIYCHPQNGRNGKARELKAQLAQMKARAG